jgi:hypothetical protein
VKIHSGGNDEFNVADDGDSIEDFVKISAIGRNKAAVEQTMK